MKFRVFWNVVSCSRVEVDRRFRDAYCHHHQGDHHRIPETSVHFNVTTRRYIPEDSKLHSSCRENLKSHKSLKNVYYTVLLRYSLVS
jgi:hypothetical protein